MQLDERRASGCSEHLITKCAAQQLLFLFAAHSLPSSHRLLARLQAIPNRCSSPCWGSSAVRSASGQQRPPPPLSCGPRLSWAAVGWRASRPGWAAAAPSGGEQTCPMPPPPCRRHRPSARFAILAQRLKMTGVAAAVSHTGAAECRSVPLRFKATRLRPSVLADRRRSAAVWHAALQLRQPAVRGA